MERQYYQDIGYKPFLFYLIFGVSGEELEVSREKHHVDELPEGLDLRTLTRAEHGDYIDGFLTGAMGNVLAAADQTLFQACKDADRCVVLQGSVAKDDTLDYMRNVIGIIQAFIDKGAVGILDPQTISLYSGDTWTERFFEQEVNAQKHAVILCSEDYEGYWLHTRGMAEFGRPDIGIHNVGEDQIHDYEQVINQMIFYGGQGMFFQGKARLHTFDGKAFVVMPELVNDFENDEYNNAYYDVTVMEDK